MRVWYFRLKARLILSTMIGSFETFHTRNTYFLRFSFSRCIDCRDAVDSVSWINFHGQKQVDWGKVHLNGGIRVSEMLTDSKGPQQYIPSIWGTNFSYGKYEAKNVEVLQKKRGVRALMKVGTYIIGPTPCVYEYINQRKKPRSLGNLFYKEKQSTI